MASTYGIITIAQLEAYMAVDFSTIEANYTDTVVDAWISQAERIVVAYTKQTYTASSAPAAVISVVMDLSSIIANNQMSRDGFIPDPQVRVFLDTDMMMMLDTLLDEEKSEGSVYEVVGVEDYV